MFLSLALMFISGLSTGIFLSILSLGFSLYLKDSPIMEWKSRRLGRGSSGAIVGAESFSENVFASVPTGVVTTPDGNFYGDVFSNAVTDSDDDDESV